ncbi:MAG: acetylxylan esterase [Pirellulaceae bacterium]|nr:acetylxylan esterase [Pirellulaceae bacterium]
MFFSPSPRLPLSLSFFLLASFVIAADFPAPEKLSPNPNLPDPLVMLDGTKVTSQEIWATKRKPELKALFQHYMYGRIPPAPRELVAKELFVDPAALGGKATLREYQLGFVGPDGKTLQHQQLVLVVTPSGKKNVPLFVGMNFCGNHTVLDDPRIQLPTGWVRNSCAGAKDERATDEGRGSQKDTWNVDLILDRGYGLATFYSGDIDPDTADFSDGIAPQFFQSGTATPAGDDPATIACWAWGYSRVVDCLARHEGQNVDLDRLIAVGHSRNGKTALLAGAMDDRFAIVIPHQAGCGGTSPCRNHNPKAETVQRINTSFPHWFCPNFKAFNEHTERLPFDQHCLIALCAPRPVLLCNAIEDQWANPDGQFQMLAAATPVYQLLGVPGLDPAAKPEIGKLTTSRLGYFLRAGKHSMSRPDWVAYLDFADAQWKSMK